MKKHLKSSLHSLLLCLLIIGCNQKGYPLHDAVLHEDISKIKLILDTGYDINKVDNRGRTALYTASLEGSKEIVQYLLVRGADVEKAASWKSYKTPLHNASEQGYREIVELLINKGAKVDIKDSGGNTPLLYATSNQNISVAKYLCEKGADINISDNHGHTPLIEACRICSEDIVGLLISKGANIYKITKEGRSASSYAKECDNKKINKLIENASKS